MWSLAGEQQDAAWSVTRFQGQVSILSLPDRRFIARSASSTASWNPIWFGRTSDVELWPLPVDFRPGC